MSVDVVHDSPVGRLEASDLAAAAEAGSDAARSTAHHDHRVRRLLVRPDMNEPGDSRHLAVYGAAAGGWEDDVAVASVGWRARVMGSLLVAAALFVLGRLG